MGGVDEFRDSGYRLVCSLDDLPRFLRENVVDEVLIALPVRPSTMKHRGLRLYAREQGILFRLLPNLFDLKRRVTGRKK